MGGRMKIMNVIIFFVLADYNAGFSQGYFPLEKGNQWDFGTLNFPAVGYQYEFSIKVMGDTVMPNSKKYAIVNDDNHFGYLRQEGTVLYNYTDAGDMIEHDFSWKNGDTTAHRPVGNDTIITIVDVGIGERFGKNFKYWASITKAIHNLGYEPSWRTIADSLGYIYFGFSPGIYYYCMGIRVNGKVYGTVTRVTGSKENIPVRFALAQNYPNPFNPSTTISFSLPSSSFVTLKISDVLGMEVATVANEELSAGDYSRTWNAGAMPSGMYFYRLQAGANAETKRMLLLK
jgi:hypothetical protein